MVTRLPLLAVLLAGCALAAGLGDFTPAGTGGAAAGGAAAGGAAAQGGGGGHGGQDPCASDLVISEARTTGSAQGSDDFVEIYNPTVESISLEDVSLAGRTPSGGVNERWRGGPGEVLAPRQHFLIVGQQFDDGGFDVKLDASGSFPNNVILLLRRGPVEFSEPIDVVCLCTEDCASNAWSACGDVVLANPALAGGRIEAVDDSVQRVPECQDSDTAGDFEAGPATPTAST